MKKRFCILLALLMLLVAIPFNACSDKPGDDGAAEDPAAVPDGQPAAEADDEPEVYAANIPEGTDLGGYGFRILVYDGSSSVWHDADFFAEELSGDVLNDAVYRRKLTVEDLLNVDIVTCPEAAYCYTPMYTSVQSGDDAYDAGFVGLQDSFNLAEKKMIYDLNTVDDLELDAPWWDQNCVEQLSVNHKNYQITGDISILYRKSIRVLYYNKALGANYQLNNPYTMVDEKTWTVDALTDLCSAVSEDLDGNGIFNDSDRYGLVYSGDTARIAFIASGVSYATKDENDLPVLTFYSEKTVSVWEKYADLLLNPQISANCSKNPWEYEKMFLADQGLFCCMELHHVEGLREMDHDFGILPLPLFDESQDAYHVMVNFGPAAACLIPVTNLELSRTAWVLDALGAEGKNTLTPAYYESYLKGKTTRDEESRTSLEIIFNSVLYDVGACFDWGDITHLPRELLDSESRDIASAYQKKEKIVKKAMERTLKSFTEETP
ncbi:MAG: hypothetical protein K6G29_06545 [Clostridiales bacterium]|nr:hypothetical protein [Clostridiales bacterium]